MGVEVLEEFWDGYWGPRRVLGWVLRSLAGFEIRVHGGLLDGNWGSGRALT